MWLLGSPKPNLSLGTLVPSFPLLSELVQLGPQELATHKHIIGVSGTGKSFFLVGCFLDLFQQGVGVTFIDPHSDSVNAVLEQLAARGYFKRADAYKKLWYVEFREDDHFIPFNFLRQNSLPHTISGNFKEALHRAWPGLSGGSAPMFDTLIQDGVKVLISNNLPITSLYDLLTIQHFRDGLLKSEDDEDVVSFFHNQFDRLSEKDRADQAGAALRRAHLLTFNPALKYSLGQMENVLDFPKIIDSGISVLFNLGSIHDLEARRLIGCLLTISYELAALTREGSSRLRTQHHLILDEMAEFVSQSEQALSRMLSQTRKYGLFAWLAHQTWSQASAQLRGALQNCQVEIAFGVGREDAEHLAKVLGRIDPEAIKSDAKTETQHDVYKEAVIQWEEQIQRLIELPPRNALVKIKGRPTVQMKTPTIRKARVQPEHIEAIKMEYRRLLTKPKSEVSLIRQRPEEPPRQTIRFGPVNYTS